MGGGLNQPSFPQGIKGPEVFFGHLLGHLLGAQVFGQDFPSVGFHFQMPAFSWVPSQPIKGFSDVIPRVFHPVSGRSVQGDVKMNSPLVAKRFLIQMNEGKGQIKILVASEDSSIPANDDLMEIDFLDELAQSLQVFRTRLNAKGGAQVKFA